MKQEKRNEPLITEDETTGRVDGPGAQTSNKQGLASSSRKPSNPGPDAHQEHIAPVDGAFGKQEDPDREVPQQETYIGAQVPADKARKR
jgi:hypothetical protein